MECTTVLESDARARSAVRRLRVSAPLISHPYFLPLPGLPLPAGVALFSAEPGREVLLLEPAVSEAFLVACTASASTWVGSGSGLGLGLGLGVRVGG